jgi:predicted HAD superfamily Cof-like phosphohydrolase
MTSHYQDVLDFHTKFEVPLASTTTLLEGEALEFRIKFLQEELDEFKKAHVENNLEDAIDALIDLQYVLAGTAQMMGISPEQWQEHWDVVQNANMSKVRAQSASESKRGTSLDVVKPFGWTAPNHTPIIQKYL